MCDDICGGGDKAKKALVEIQNWFAETCNVKKVAASEGSSKSGSSSGDDGGSGTHPWYVQPLTLRFLKTERQY
ncbi:hypothetical protein IMZ48_06245 [Candidatus Bathyarchaeota archaeon]|nr:hypothetical protein [Candidatus Bathyarchaeota archaeon]